MSEAEHMPPPIPDRRRWTIEAVVITLVGVVPHALNSLAAFATEQSEATASVTAMYLGLSGASLGIIAVAMFVAWSNPEGTRAFGYHRLKAIDVLYAAALMASAYVAYLVYWATVGPVYWYLNDGSAPAEYGFSMPRTASEYLVTFTSLALNGAAEELVLWSVLFTRLERLWKNPIVPVVVVSMAFASYHLYQGVFAMGGVACMGLVNGAFFAWKKRIWPLIIAHAVWDMLLLM